MDDILGSPLRAALAGLALTAIALIAWVLADPVDPQGLVSVLLRFVHVLSAMAWVGLIFFVNFIQLVVLQKADEPARGAIAKWIVPRVRRSSPRRAHDRPHRRLTARLDRYLFGDVVFSSAVYMPPTRTAMLTAGAVGGILMWAFVNFLIWPSLKIVLGQAPGDPQAQLGRAPT